MINFSDFIHNWKEDLIALVTTILLFIYGPPHKTINLFVFILCIELVLTYILNRKHPQKTTEEYIIYSLQKIFFYTIFILIGNGFDLYLFDGIGHKCRGYSLFVLFIVETSQILSLATAFGFAKEVLMIKTVYSTLIKNNPLGQIAASEFKEKKEDKNASSK